MAKKSLQSLEKYYEVEDFFDYICETYINGNKQSAIELFYEMKPQDKSDFMNELNWCTFTDRFGDGPWQMELLQMIIRTLPL